MVKITQDEAEYLRRNGRGDDVHMSSSTHKGRAKRYYLTTAYKSMVLLDKYRRSITVETYKAGGQH